MDDESEPHESDHCLIKCLSIESYKGTFYKISRKKYQTGQYNISFMTKLWFMMTVTLRYLNTKSGFSESDS